MNTQTLLLLLVVAVMAGYAALAYPALGTALAVSAAVLGVVYLILKDDQGSGN